MMRIESGPLESETRAALAHWVEEFEPLDFEAGRRAKAWLKSNLDLGALPLDCYFCFNDRDEDELFGFMALGELEVEVAPYDLPIMQVRGTISGRHAERHLATKLAWIARSRVSPAGLGSKLFDHALLVATLGGSCALTVDPLDRETAERLWIRHYHLRKPRVGGKSWSSLWCPTGKADQSFC